MKNTVSKRKIKTALEVLEAYKKEHKQGWLDFMKGMLWGYMGMTRSDFEYEEAKVSEFEEWCREEIT